MNKNTKEAVYIKIYNEILVNIENNNFSDLYKLPSENEFSSIYNVNRHTIRKSLSLLKNKGYIYTKKGKGNYICNIKVPYSISKKSSYSSRILDLGYEPKTKLLAVNIIESYGEIAENLDLKNGLKVFEVKLLRYANDLPIALSYSYFDAYIYKNLMNELKNKECFSLYKAINTAYPNLEIKKESTVFEALLANKEQSKLLMMPLNEPLLAACTISKDQNGNYVEYGTSYFRSDVCKIKVDLK